MNILVVDDDEMVRYVLAEKLAESGYSVSTACDGETAVQLFREAAFDAVLLDLRMPGMDGRETLKELRRCDPHIPVIMVTAYGDIATAVETIKLGAYDFVEKPPQISRIMVTLRRAMEMAALEHEVRDLGKNLQESATVKQAYEKLRELDQMKSAFLSCVSHELRTPLTSIIGYAEINRKKLAKLIPLISSDEQLTTEIGLVQENLDIIASESERLKGMITSILDLVAMEAGTAQWRWEPLSLGEVVESVATGFSPKFEKKGLDFVVEIEENLPLIMGDRYRISQVVSHLLANAAKFTAQGRVTCSVKSAGHKIRVCIADTGKGIIAAQHRAIFDKFKQIGEVLIDKPKGVGLGLPICRLIVEYHGGTIGVESEPGTGSVFTMLLPAGRDAGI